MFSTLRNPRTFFTDTQSLGGVLAQPYIELHQARDQLQQGPSEKRPGTAHGCPIARRNPISLETKFRDRTEHQPRAYGRVGIKTRVPLRDDVITGPLAATEECNAMHADAGILNEGDHFPDPIGCYAPQADAKRRAPGNGRFHTAPAEPALNDGIGTP